MNNPSAEGVAAGEARHGDRWKLPKPRVSLRLGIVGHKEDIARVVPWGDNTSPSCLVDFLEGLNDTLLAIRDADRQRSFPSRMKTPFLALISRSLRSWGYRVDSETLYQRDVSVYSDQSAQFLLRVMEPSLEELLQPLPGSWPGRPMPSDTAHNEPARRNEVPEMVIERVRLGDQPVRTARDASYLFAILLHHSDLLVAVWSEEESERREAADSMIRRALAEGIDVVAIQLHQDRVPVVAVISSDRELGWLHQGKPDPKGLLSSCSLGKGMTRDDLQKLRAEWNPTMEFPDAPCNEVEEKSRSSAYLYHPRASFLRLMHKEAPPQTWVGSCWTWYRKVTDTLFRLFHFLSSLPSHLLGRGKDHHQEDEHDPKVIYPKGKEPFEHPAWPPYFEIYDAADHEFSNRHGTNYRGGIIASNALAVLAVTLAMAGARMHMEHQHAETMAAMAAKASAAPTEELAANSHTKNEHPEDHASDHSVGMVGHAGDGSGEHAGDGGFWLAFGLGGLELVTVLLMFGISLWSVTRGWRLQFTENRMLAEGIRIWRFLMGSGLHTPMPRLPHYLRGDGVAPSVDATWSLWYFRALVRQFPLQTQEGGPMLHFDQGLENARQLAVNQISYHRKNSERQHFIHELVEGISWFLFLLVLFCVGLHLLELWLHRSFGGEFGMFCCILGPLLIAVLHGVASQLEVQRLRQRSASVAKLLKDRMVELDRIEAEAKASGGPTLEDHWHLARETLQIGSILIDETAGWSMLYRARDIHAG